MQHKTPKLLEDIRDSATFILEAVASLTLDTYARDRIRRQAVERNFEIIGEALNRLSRVDSQVSRRIGPGHKLFHSAIFLFMAMTLWTMRSCGKLSGMSCLKS